MGRSLILELHGCGLHELMVNGATAEEQRTFQLQHGEKYIQLKNYTDQLEAELRETKSKMEGLSTANEELREVGAFSFHTLLLCYKSKQCSRCFDC